MYWQQTRLLRQFFTPELELLAEKELLHNILSTFGAYRLQLPNLTLFNAFLIRSEVFKISRVCWIISKALGLFRLRVEIKSKIFFFSCSFTFLNLFRSIFKAFFMSDFIILSGQCCFSRIVSRFFNLISLKESFPVIMQILRARENRMFFKQCLGLFDLKET